MYFEQITQFLPYYLISSFIPCGPPILVFLNIYIFLRILDLLVSCSLSTYSPSPMSFPLCILPPLGCQRDLTMCLSLYFKTFSGSQKADQTLDGFKYKEVSLSRSVASPKGHATESADSAPWYKEGSTPLHHLPPPTHTPFLSPVCQVWSGALSQPQLQSN